MTAPDTSGYLDLTPLDLTPQALVDAAVTQAQATIPEWTPAEAQTEMVLLEAVAVMVAEAVFAINRLPGTVSEILLRLFGFIRDVGGAATGAVTFTVADTSGYTIPAGSQLTVQVSGLVDPVLIETTGDLVIFPGATSATVGVVTVALTSIANGTPAGTPCAVIAPLPLVDAATLTTGLADGRDPEDGRAFLDRAISYLATLSSTLVRSTDFIATAMTQPGIGRAYAIDAYDPAVGPAAGDNPGHVTVLALDDNGTALTPAVKAALLAVLTSRASGDLDIHIADPTVTTVPVVAAVQAQPGHDPATVQAAAVAAVQAWLSPAVWPWAGTVRRNDLIAVLSGVPGVAYVISVTTPAADQVLTGAGPLASAGTVTISVS